MLAVAISTAQLIVMLPVNVLVLPVDLVKAQEGGKSAVFKFQFVVGIPFILRELAVDLSERNEGGYQRAPDSLCKCMLPCLPLHAVPVRCRLASGPRARPAVGRLLNTFASDLATCYCSPRS